MTADSERHLSSAVSSVGPMSVGRSASSYGSEPLDAAPPTRRKSLGALDEFRALARPLKPCKNGSVRQHVHWDAGVVEEWWAACQTYDGDGGSSSGGVRRKKG